MLSVLPFIMLAASVEIWAEPSLIDPMDPGERSAYADDFGRIYAARGELESFQLCVYAKRKDLEKLTLEVDPVDETLPAPRVFLLGRLAAKANASRQRLATQYLPDPLEPQIPITLEKGKQVVYWLLYQIPSTAKAGIRRHRLRLKSEGNRDIPFEVRVEVFDFDLPQQPSLPVLCALNREQIQQAYGMENRDLEGWKSIYDDLAPYKISYNVWQGGNLVQVQFGGAADTEHFKAHLEYAVESAHMSSIELGGGGQGLQRLTPAALKAGQADPLGAYMQDMSQWLRERQWLSRATMQVARLSGRSQWDAVSTAYARAARQEAHIPRLFVGPPHPFFERYVDLWTLPFSQARPELIVRFHQDFSQSDSVARIPTRLSASSSGATGYERSAQDAADGSRFSAWHSQEAPTKKAPQWWQAEYHSAQEVERIYLYWEPGYEADEIEVSTSYDGALYSSATVKWDHHFATKYFEESYSIGTLKYKNTLQGLRLIFTQSRTEKAVGLQEIQIDAPETAAPPRPIPSIRPWLAIGTDSFPSAAAGAHAVEARALPWLCHIAHFQGAYAGPLNRWPTAWRESMPLPGQPWKSSRGAEDFLFYPGENGLLPSIRLLRLCDGIEDYEYLQHYDTVITPLQMKREKLFLPQLPPWGFAAPEWKSLDALRDWLLKQRIALGRAIEEEKEDQ